jgi:hypothetical protein
MRRHVGIMTPAACDDNGFGPAGIPAYTQGADRGGKPRPMSAAHESTLSPSHHIWLRAGLIVVAGLELMDAVPNLGTLAALPPDADTLTRLVQALLDAKLMLSPLAAGAGLLLAAAGFLRPAVLALAGFAFMGWALDDLWVIVVHGFEFRPDRYYGSLDAFAHQVVFPLGALLGAGLALRNQHLAWAGFFASLPPLFNWTVVILFTVSILLHGF